MQRKDGKSREAELIVELRREIATLHVEIASLQAAVRYIKHQHTAMPALALSQCWTGLSHCRHLALGTGQVQQPNLMLHRDKVLLK